MTLLIERPQDLQSSTPHATSGSPDHNEPVALLTPVDTRHSTPTVYVSRDSVVVREDYRVYVGSASRLSPVRVISWHRDPNSGDLTIVTDDQTVYIPQLTSRWFPYYGEAKMYRMDDMTITEMTDEWVSVN